MKRLLTLCLLLALGATSAPAQPLPNGTLEAWTTTSGPDHAAHWLSTDDLLAATLGLVVATGTTTRTADAHGGSFAARLETKAFPPFDNLPAHLVLGDQVSLPDTDFSGLPFAERPTALQLYYKLTGPNAAADSAAVQVVLTRFAAGRREVVAEGLAVFDPAADYTLATVPLRYLQSQAPDSIHVIITSGGADALTAGTTLYVDDISLSSSSPLAARAARPAGRLSCYPNPSADGRFELAATELGLASAAFAVYDALGRVVLAQPAGAPAATRLIDLRGQPAGLYTLRLAAAGGPVAQRLVVP